MRLLRGMLIGFAIFIGLLLLGLFVAITRALVHQPMETSHATALSAVLAGILAATIFNPYFYAALSASLLAGYMLAKPRNTAKPTP